MRTLLQEAAHDGRDVVLLATTSSASGEAIASMGPMAAEAASQHADRLVPEAWPTDWLQSRDALKNLDHARIGDAIWLASGLGSVDARSFYDALQALAPTKVYLTSAPIYDLASPTEEGDKLSIAAMRAMTDQEASIVIDAVAHDGNVLAHWDAQFVAGAPRTVVPLDLPGDLRNRITRFEIEGQRSAAAITLLDAAWEHRTVGIVGDAAELDRHSLLSEIYYIDRALKPYADIHIDALDVLVKSNPSMIVLTDTATIADDVIDDLEAWVKKGGVLVRFAGENFAAADHNNEHDLIPVPLRGGGERALGGAMTWDAAQTLQAFPATSPFYNLPMPNDVSVNRQVLAEPSPEVTSKTWAALTDGTPLVTATRLGQGMSVLFHVPARTGWSNLPISGLFVDMLRRIVGLSHGGNAMSVSATTLPPWRIFDAYGDEKEPTSTVMPLPIDALTATPLSPQHPPGLYGTEANAVAFNLGVVVGQPEALHNIPTEIFHADRGPTDLQAYLLVAAFLLLIADALLSLRLRGLLKIAAIFLALLLPMKAHAADDDKAAIDLTSKTYLAYVRTGDATTDHVSELGLHGLALALQKRTSMDDIGVTGVDPDRDNLALLPLLYWPIVPGEKPVTPEGARRVTYYLHHGGMILFDGVDGGSLAPGFLRQTLAGVDMPALVRIPDKHVLKRSFYLLDSFPGRFANDDLWLEPEDASAYDGVASVLYGANGWAAAWAMDDGGRALYPCTPGGEQQREQAIRFGVNLVMYALTGNYKNDQVHASALLKRMAP
jgi:hypothetical protein